MVKIERSPSEPASLAAARLKGSGKYNDTDVVKQLREDCGGKCYICEIAPVQDAEVEHRLPHKDGRYLNRKYDWWNLFFCCRHCNGVKNNPKYDEGIIDCCRRDPENVLRYHVNGNGVSVTATNQNDKEAVLTAMLTEEVYNKRNTGIRINDCEVRFEELNKKMILLYRQMRKLRENPNNRRAKRELRHLLDRKSAFAGFLRSYVRENGEFMAYL